ncbi:hypothetical protein BY996DRAFT_8490537 [Phakopsora pachyrhizi]|nr:hypothetical protein BY996DRAFT_8490537 [Phakopsora pachyrhizi]
MVYKALPSFIVDRCKSEKILQMPNSDLIMKPEWINLQALESTITMKAGDIETLALILRPFAELPKWAYVYLGNVVEVCEMMRAVDDNFRPSTVFKNIDPKSSSGFIVVYEELLTSRSLKAGKVALTGKTGSPKMIIEEELKKGEMGLHWAPLAI